jgi:hypothetical protein
MLIQTESIQERGVQMVDLTSMAARPIIPTGLFYVRVGIEFYLAFSA